MLKDNRKLLLALIVLASLFFIVRWMKSDKNVRNFKTELFTLDTAEVASFSLYSKAANHEEIKFEKANGNWAASKNNITTPIPADQISGMLSALLSIKPQRLAARSKDKWAQYEVTDSLGTRLVVRNAAGKEMVDIILGKFSIKQGPPQSGFGGGQNNISGLSYIRNTDETETYATEGFLTMTFNRDFNSFRNKQLVQCTPEQVRNISIQTPANGFTLSKTGNGWMMGDVKADSVKVVSYLNQIKNLSATKIDDAYQPSGEESYSCLISGDNMEAIHLSVYPMNGVFKIKSSLNPDTVFESDSTGVFAKVFKEGIDFVAGE